jgi:hypothetical protein
MKGSQSEELNADQYRALRHISPKSRHRPVNPHSAKAQDFYNHIIIIAVRNSNLVHVSCVYFTFKANFCIILCLFADCVGLSGVLIV